MTLAVALFLTGTNIVLLYLLMGARLGVVSFRQSITVACDREWLWSAIWPLGVHAGWSNTIRSATNLGGGKIRTELTWKARDGSPVFHELEVTGFVDGERFTVRVVEDNTLDQSFWAHYVRSVEIHPSAAGQQLTVAVTDRYRGAAFMLFRYFALRRELKKLKVWAETGTYRAGGITEHPVTQFISAGISTLIFWAALGFTQSGFLMAFLLTLVIVFHELGHMAAFRLMGHDNARMIFIPLLGGLAFGARPYNSHYEIAFSALMGAGFSAFLVPISIGAYHLALAQGQPLLAEAAFYFGGFCALFNLCNLLPIWKFDGGQVLRQLFRGDVALASVSFLLLLVFFWIGFSAGFSPSVLLVCGLVIAFLSVFTRGSGAKPRDSLVSISGKERILISLAMIAVLTTHASGFLWAASLIAS
jgi:Zn-dependent protease